MTLYFKTTTDQCSARPGVGSDVDQQPDRVERQQPPVDKPLVLVWFAPFNTYFDFNDCGKYFNISSCILTYNRSLYQESKAVIFFHKAINWQLQNLPTKEPRPPTQKWIWYHVESPTNTARIPGLENLFNLTLSYRRDADITVRTELAVRKQENQKNTVSESETAPDVGDDFGEFVLPKKERLVCWIVSNTARATGTGTRERYYEQLAKHVKVDVFGAAFHGRWLAYEEYFPTIASCKFYLSFENSIHRDYITEKLNGPFVAGTVPVVMGPPRENYEQLMPAGSFIHVDDFPNPKALADYLLELDQDHEKYSSYFLWRKSYKASPHLLSLHNEFTQPICLACDHMSRDRGYSVVAPPTAAPRRAPRRAHTTRRCVGSLDGGLIETLADGAGGSAHRQHDPSDYNKVSRKPLVLLWFWPEDLQFDLDDCRKHFNISGCRLTDDRSLFLKAKEVIVFHDAIKDDLSNLPKLPRPGFQRWMWLNMEPPENTRKIQAADNLFNVSLTFRKDADVKVRWELTYSKTPRELPVPPKKDHLVCYMRDDKVADNSSAHSYYKELAKHIDINVFTSLVQNEYFDAVGSCKFHLAFEKLIYRDYITEKLNGPLAVGTVPVVLGPPRKNYEDFVPSDSFVHVNDFPDAKSLADFLKRLDADDDAYKRYFQWRKHFSAERQPLAENHKYLKAICTGCLYSGRNRNYREEEEEEGGLSGFREDGMGSSSRLSGKPAGLSCLRTVRMAASTSAAGVLPTRYWKVTSPSASDQKPGSRSSASLIWKSWPSAAEDMNINKLSRHRLLSAPPPPPGSRNRASSRSSGVRPRWSWTRGDAP
ncbi:hypothetical protein CRUP_022267 [Coryphaenoides rupestris]|nr:hypothetical protein CRUP_022267 [Coryphaenoides rupestris]